MPCSRAAGGSQPARSAPGLRTGDGANRRPWWQGNPAAFQIDGRTAAGLDFVMTSGNSGVNESRWSTELSVRYPALAGAADIVELARPPDWPADALNPHSLRTWRDRRGLHFDVRLPGPPNWATVSYAATLDATARS